VRRSRRRLPLRSRALRYAFFVSRSVPEHGSWALWVAPSAPQCAAGAYGTANHDIAAEPDRSKRPGDREQCRGPTSAHRSSPVALHQPSVACNSGARTFCSTPKRCNPNDV